MRKALFTAVAVLFGCGLPASAYTDQEISNALMANAWCSFSYNQTTGYSHSKRGVFSADGSLNVSSNNEGGSSGYGGSYYGQSRGGDNYGWRVQGGVLYLSEGGSWAAHTLDAKYNSNRSLILIVDGTEWESCR